ncbi:trans-aconitate 2-methyltransferase [Roseivirga sp. E12]|uniref:class I SAM-dependent methyltransferase n=1 Tax=Roseivirga sp. E12 TaxID=2819237 RepID=UPI001ABD35C1|nr:class I SAM-dependent methyltransferase [Roseivirga sp. E12]MBO3699065.1 methyltransferase domain-containing protein [Roseivirga sp. E12]
MRNLKATIVSLKTSRFLIGRLVYTAAFLIISIPEYLASAQKRSELWYGVRYGKDYHQKASFTLENRYPDLFSICQNYFNYRSELKILSFGCSTGEEVKTLSQVFPKAEVVGVDINKRSLRKARKNYENSKVSFLHSESMNFKNASYFNVIFCCAVFQKTDNRDQSNHESKYLFSKFEKAITELDKKLNKGGLLVIDHSDFLFTDTSLFRNYEVLDAEGNRLKRNRPYYDSNNKRVSSFTETNRVYIKISDN